MLYEEYETEFARNNLPRVLSAVPAPACLIGGWAVYHTVNADYKATTGKSYQGSKDIDLGFHIDKDATVESLRETDLAKACRSLEEMGFRGMGSRLFREYHRETRYPLSEAKAKKTPSYNLLQLYVDLRVDTAPKGIKKAVGFAPFDEKLLVHVFKEGMYKAIDELPADVILPTPQVLLAMKISSLPNRPKDHKRYKDIMDAYALIWHSGVPMQRLYSDVSRLVSRGAIARALSAISSSDYEQAADPLEIDPKKLEAVITGFIDGGGAAGRLDAKSGSGAAAAHRRRRRRSGSAGGRAVTPATVQDATAGSAGGGAQPGKETPPPPGVVETEDLGVMTIKGVGQVRVNDLETLRLAEMYMDVLRKKVSAGAAHRPAASGGRRQDELDDAGVRGRGA